MKKIELHVHLDGSLNVEYANKLMKKDITNELVATNTSNLKEYLEKFKIPKDLTQSKENLKKFSELLAKDLVKDEVIYAEIRFCPLLHTSKLTKEEVVENVLEGLNSVKEIKTNLILCMMRNFSEEENIQIIELAKKYLNKGVVAIDLAGDESNYKTGNYKKLFELAKENKIPFTIHAGEADDYTSIESAISFKTKRIGHGIRCIENKNTIKKIIENDITLEICPTSNINTQIYKSLKDYPIKDLINKGIKVTINTDNRTVSNTSLEKEYNLLKEECNLTEEDLIKCNLNAIEVAFISEEEKNQLKKEILTNFKTTTL